MLLPSSRFRFFRSVPADPDFISPRENGSPAWFPAELAPVSSPPEFRGEREDSRFSGQEQQSAGCHDPHPSEPPAHLKTAEMVPYVRNFFLREDCRLPIQARRNPDAGQENGQFLGDCSLL